MSQIKNLNHFSEIKASLLLNTLIGLQKSDTFNVGNYQFMIGYCIENPFSVEVYHKSTINQIPFHGDLDVFVIGSESWSVKKRLNLTNKS